MNIYIRYRLIAINIWNIYNERVQIQEHILQRSKFDIKIM